MTTTPRIRVGDQVLVRFGSERIRGEVLEDRGKLGENGTRVLRVGWTPTHSDELLELEVPESDVEPAASRLTSDERQVLGALIMPPDAALTEKTVPKIASRTGLDEGQVARALRKLEDMEPPLVHRETDAKLKVEFWMALVRGAEALEDGRS